MNLSKDNRRIRLALLVIKNEHIFQGLGLLFAFITGLCAVFWISGAEIEPLAFGMSLVMSVFFALPSFARKVTEVRPIERMNFTEIIELVENTRRGDWRSIDEDGIEEVFYLRDPRLRIKHHSGVRGIQNDDFKEKWANAFPDPKAMGLWFDLYYDQGILKRVLLVAVDGFRAYIPCPMVGTKNIEKFSHRVAEITAFRLDLYHEYLNRLDFEIVPTEISKQVR